MSFRIDIERHLMLELLHPRQYSQLFRLVDQNRDYLKTWLPWLDNVIFPLDIKPYLESSWRGYFQKEGFSMGILVEGELKGMISYHAFDRTNRVTSLGYWLAKSASGKGIMRKCVQALIQHAFEIEDMNRICIRCATGNLRSRRIAEVLGFVHEGCQREAEWLYDHFLDLEVYSLLRSEWLEQ